MLHVNGVSIRQVRWPAYHRQRSKLGPSDVCREADSGSPHTMTTHDIATETNPMTADRVVALLDCFRHSGAEVATVYLPSGSATTEADQQFEIHVKNARTNLERQGATSGLIDRVIAALDAHDHDDGPALLIVATPDDLLLDMTMDRPVERLVTSVGPTPLLLPMLATAQVDEPHLAVLLDRTGADVYFRDGVRAPIDALEVEGNDVRVHRGHPGGWSQKRLQQTAENAWENNATDVIDAIIEEFGRDLPVIVAGDERAVGFFRSHLPKSMEQVLVEGSRHADHDAFLDNADLVMRTRAAERVIADLDRFRSAVGAGRAAKGREVLDQLSRGQVAHLLVGNDALDTDRLTGRFDFSVPMHRLDNDHGTATIAPITEGAVAIAVNTGATITVVPYTVSGLEDGLGAVLRF